MAVATSNKHCNLNTSHMLPYSNQTGPAEQHNKQPQQIDRRIRYIDKQPASTANVEISQVYKYKIRGNNCKLDDLRVSSRQPEVEINLVGGRTGGRLVYLNSHGVRP